MEELEYNILGSKIRVKSDSSSDEAASVAINLVNKEIEALRKKNSKLSDIDTAVLVALNLAAKLNETDEEFQSTMSSFKTEITEALYSLDDTKA